MSPAPESAAGAAQIAVALTLVLAVLVALFGSRRMTSVVGFLVFGALLSLYWALIDAPDVALAEAAIGTGVTGALFIATVTALERKAPIRSSGWRGITVTMAVGSSLAAVIGLALTRAAAASPQAPNGVGLGAAVQDALPETGVSHPVTGVLLSLRSLDTLMEMVVLLAAVAVALVVLPDGTAEPRVAEPAQTPHPRSPQDGPDPGRAIIDHFVRLSAPLMILLAIWLLFAGSTRPGGAFQSGAVLAATLILLHLGGIWRLTVRPMVLVALAAGLSAFLAMALGGLLGAGTWLEVRGPGAGWVILAVETVLAVTIGASLAIVFLAASAPSLREQQENR